MEINNNSNQASSKVKWNREDIASTIVDFESTKEGLSQRQFSKTAEYPEQPCNTGCHAKNPLMLCLN